jgi:Zn-dependent M28 family amino/carboxypeptidase
MPLFAAAGHPLDAVLAAADKEGGRPRGFALQASVKIALASTWRAIKTENVVALLRGSDPALAGESVVLSAHLDHLGVGGNGPDKIYNGAMDNAAGVATMLAAARALVATPERPRRSVLFVALTGEESGQLGSDYLARHPLPAAGKMVADVNFDMPVLLYRFTDLVAFGAQHSTIGPIAAAAAKRDGITLAPDPIPEEGIFTRSDHYRFVQQGIPAVFVVPGFAGEGEKQFRAFLKDHYHQPSDDLSLPFDWEAGALFARVNTHIVLGIANADMAPRWYAGDFFGHEYAAGAAKAPKP